MEQEVIEIVIKVITMKATPSDVEVLRKWANLSKKNRERLSLYHHEELLDPSFDVTRGFDKEKSWVVLSARIGLGG